MLTHQKMHTLPFRKANLIFRGKWIQKVFQKYKAIRKYNYKVDQTNILSLFC